MIKLKSIYGITLDEAINKINNLTYSIDSNHYSIHEEMTPEELDTAWFEYEYYNNIIEILEKGKNDEKGNKE